jgi:hypothetical protein
MNEYLKKITSTDNPFVLTNAAGYFISDSLRNQSVKLYDSYLINGECIRIRASALIQPSWGENIRIRHCIDILNQKLLAQVFDDTAAIGFLSDLGEKIFTLNTEKRPHYIANNYMQLMGTPVETSLLEALAEVRIKYDSLPDDDGPYHTESFPWDYCEPENILLDKQPFAQPEQVFSSPHAEDIFVALAQI